MNNNQVYNQKFIHKGKYEVFNEDLLTKDFSSYSPFDIIISYMVMEHLDLEQRKLFIDKAK